MFCAQACSWNKEVTIQDRLKGDTLKNNVFVNEKYVKQIPLAEIIDVKVRTEYSKTFEMKSDGEVQIYGVGELIYNLAESTPEYFLKSDDTELFFNVRNDDSNSLKKDKDVSFVFSWVDGIENKNLKKENGKSSFMKILDNGAELYGFKSDDSLSQKYISEVRISWKSLGNIKPADGTKIDFDIAIGDTDDYYVQKSKIMWYNTHDISNRTTRKYGTLLLKDDASAQVTGVMLSLKNNPQTDWVIEELWASVPSYNIENVVNGIVKDKYDLSAKVKSCWSNDSLYFYIEAQDSQRKRIGEDTKRKKQTMLDYGWIEDAKGKKVWEMHALDTKIAGGALKNHKSDTIIHLKKGNYILKYSSDESHAWEDWDDDAPHTPFYGIVVYLKK